MRLQYWGIVLESLLILEDEAATGLCDRIIGFLSYTPRPCFENLVEYQFRRIDPALQSDFTSCRICLVEARSPEIADRVRDARLMLGDDCYLIAILFGSEGRQVIDSVLDAGADDILGNPDETKVLASLRRAERFATKFDRMEMRLREAELTRASGQAALDNLPTPIFFKNREGIYTWCNKAFETFLGKSAHDIVGRSVFETSPPDLAKIYYDRDETLMGQGGTQIYEADVRFADGQKRRVSFYKAAIKDQNTEAVVGLAGAMLDISERVALEKKLQEAALRDPLTGAYNRRKFFDFARRAEHSLVEGGAPFGAMVLDVDHFKKINDTFGHACGDAVLCELTQVLQENVSPGDIVARAGGEEFYLLIHGRSLEEISACGDGIRQTIADMAFEYEAERVGFSVSIGVAQHRVGERINDTIRRADKALYEAKEAGRNQVRGR